MRTGGRHAAVRRLCLLLLAGIAGMAMTGCKREQRQFTPPNPPELRADAVHLTPLQPGAPSTTAPAPVEPPTQGRAYAMAEGKRLYTAFNCVGCHAQGGGGIGPALIDDEWIYGSSPEQIYSTIVQGRPDGMPAFGGRVPTQQIWQLVAYVESMSGQRTKTASPGRPDDISAKHAESRTLRAAPRQTGHR